MYPWLRRADEIERLRGDAAARGCSVEQVMVGELRRWIDAGRRADGRVGIDVYVMPGNDDPWSCDAVLEAATHVQACDERVVQVGAHEMISCAYANPTPWNSPRELDEDALYARTARSPTSWSDPETAIFNLHVPPYDSGLDTANEMNPDLTLRYVGRPAHPIPVGVTPCARSSRSSSRCSPCTATSTSLAGRCRSAGRSRSTRGPSTTAATSTGRWSRSTVRTRCGKHQFVVG